MTQIIVIQSTIFAKYLFSGGGFKDFIGRRPFHSTLRFIQFIGTKFCLVVNYKLQQCNGLELTSENGTCFSICCETDFQFVKVYTS